MKRSAFLRITPDAATLTVKVRKRKCAAPGCAVRFTPWQSFINWCSPDCGAALAMAKLAKAERKNDRERKRAMMSRGDWLEEVQVVFNQFIRERDRDQPCICCGKYFDDKENYPGGQWDAGHWLSRGAAPHLRFVETNVHKQLKGHNRPGGCTRADFRAGMIERIGLAGVEALESDQASRNYTIEDLKALKVEYAAKLKALKGQA